jgi:hypothetical protein
VIDLIKSTPCGDEAILKLPEVKEFEFVRLGGLKLRMLDIHPTDPVAPFLQELHQVMADETTGSGN